MRILIIAVNHQIQSAQIKSGSTDGRLEIFERDQKERFGELLRNQIRARRIEFIGEEARHGEETIAQRVCQQEGCRPATNIDMTRAQREDRSIPPGYHEDTSMPQAEKDRCNREREAHMVSRVLAEAGNADSIAVICGRFHAEAIAHQLSKLGHSVDRLDLQNQDWYIEDWMAHMLQL